MRKIALLTGAASFAIVSVAQAAEHNGDVPFNNPAYLTTISSGAAVTGGKLVFTTAQNAKVTKTDPTILDKKHFLVTFTVSGMAPGSGPVRVSVGAHKQPASGSNIPGQSLGLGLPDIADNFPTTGGFDTVGPHKNGENWYINGGVPDDTDNFRIGCSPGPSKHNDPELQKGFAGGSHLHKFIGNNAVVATSDYRSLRTTGGTTCGQNSTPFDRAAYWHPPVLDGMGHEVQSERYLIYYKGVSKNYAGGHCSSAPSSTSLGICTPWPNGAQFIFGYNMATMTNGPLDTSAPEYGRITFECWGNDEGTTPANSANGLYHSIEQTRAAGCPANAILHVSWSAPNCWNGTLVGSADNRSHFAYQGTGTSYPITVAGSASQVPIATNSCPTTHPYLLSQVTYQGFFRTDANFVAARWHLSSDVAMTGMAPEAGATQHFDYVFAWSPTIKARWQLCIDNWLDCGGGDLGDGQAIKGANFTAHKMALISERLTGETDPAWANGTYTSEVIADGSGEWTVHTENWNGSTTTASVDDVSIVDVTPTHNSGSVTTHHPSN